MNTTQSILGKIVRGIAGQTACNIEKFGFNAYEAKALDLAPYVVSAKEHWYAVVERNTMREYDFGSYHDMASAQETADNANCNYYANGIHAWDMATQIIAECRRHISKAEEQYKYSFLMAEEPLKYTEQLGRILTGSVMSFAQDGYARTREIAEDALDYCRDALFDGCGYNGGNLDFPEHISLLYEIENIIYTVLEEASIPCIRSRNTKYGRQQDEFRQIHPVSKETEKSEAQRICVKYALDEISAILMEHGASIRIIPKEHWSVFEVCHKDMYPDGVVKYLDEYKREMLVVQKENPHAGKVNVGFSTTATGTVTFEPTFYDSVEDAVDYIAGLPIKDYRL